MSILGKMSSDKLVVSFSFYVDRMDDTFQFGGHLLLSGMEEVQREEGKDGVSIRF